MIHERPLVFVLGCGRSISDLTLREKQKINSADVRIAINKFTVFHKIAGIIPTHVFFMEKFSDASQSYLQRTFDVCRSSRLSVTFVVQRSLWGMTTQSRWWWWLRRFRQWAENVKNLPVYCVPRHCELEYATHHDWLTGGSWARSLDEPLYHYRGSLTSVFNYITIKWPNSIVKLVGTDFDSNQYFFEECMKRQRMPWEDWTTQYAEGANLHFSAVTYEGTTMFDELPYVVRQVTSHGIDLSCCNRNSLLVTKGGIPFSSVIDDDLTVRGTPTC